MREAATSDAATTSDQTFLYLDEKKEEGSWPPLDADKYLREKSTEKDGGGERERERENVIGQIGNNMRAQCGWVKKVGGIMTVAFSEGLLDKEIFSVIRSI